jgi:hypothetical protein
LAQRVPVKAGFHRQAFPLGMAPFAGGGADGIGRFLCLQGILRQRPDRVERQGLAQMRGELVGAQAASSRLDGLQAADDLPSQILGHAVHQRFLRGLETQYPVFVEQQGAVGADTFGGIRVLPLASVTS